MLKKDVVVGQTYLVRISGVLTYVRLDRVCSYGGWIGVNTRTGREVRIKSAQKLRREKRVEPSDGVTSC